MANWTAKDNIIGGIYPRPVSLGNLTHFVMALANSQSPEWDNKAMLVLLAIYTVFAVLFGWPVFGGGAGGKVAKAKD